MVEDDTASSSSSDTAPSPSPPSSSSGVETESCDEALVDFIYRENTNILERRGREVQHLNNKSANLMRLLGVIFTLYSGAIIVAARLSINPDTEMGLTMFINEYSLLSLLLLAAAFLYAVLAYHRTNVARGPSAEYLHENLEREMSVADAKRAINQKVPGWVRNNDDQIELDHTRLFNCKMCIFFSLSYLVIGSVLAQSLSDAAIEYHAGLFALVLAVSYISYDQIRDRAADESDT